MGHGINLHTNDGIIAQTPGVGISLAAGATVPTDGTAATRRDARSGKRTATATRRISTSMSARERRAISIRFSFRRTSWRPCRINRAADVSTRNVPTWVTTAITVAEHDGRTIAMSGAGAAHRGHAADRRFGCGRFEFRFVVAKTFTRRRIPD